MKQLKYINSRKQEIDFRQFNTQMFKANFHTYAWGIEGTAQRFGTTIERFTKSALEYEMTIAVKGGQATKENVLNTLTEITEYDVINNVQGKLYWGEYYLNCNIISASAEPSEVFFGAEKTMGIFAPHPFWIKEESRQFYPTSSGSADAETGGFDYPYDYPHDYSAGRGGNERWMVDHYAESEFIMTVYGPCVNPRVLVNGYPYEVFTTLEEGEYLTINSTENEVFKYLTGGQKVDLYDLRGKIHSVFQPMPSGNLIVNWSGDFGFDITIYLERSEPAW